MQDNLGVFRFDILDTAKPQKFGYGYKVNLITKVHEIKASLLKGAREENVEELWSRINFLLSVYRIQITISYNAYTKQRIFRIKCCNLFSSHLFIKALKSFFIFIIKKVYSEHIDSSNFVLTSWFAQVTVLLMIQEPPFEICRYSCSKPCLFIYMSCVSTCYIFS